MTNVLFYKVKALPGTLEANAFYYVQSGDDYASAWVTSSGLDEQGEAAPVVARKIGNSQMINELIDAKLDEHNSLKIVADIAQRDAIASTLNRNIVVLVTDATDDETVDVGAALYAYNAELNTFIKIAEYESMDVVLSWDSIEGRPTSSVADIDDAVGRKHSHVFNEEALNDINDAGSGRIITDDERTKLEGIEAGANLYVHDDSHSLEMIDETELLKVMTADERTKLAAVTDTGSGLIITEAERTKLEGIEEGATQTSWTTSEW